MFHSSEAYRDERSVASLVMFSLIGYASQNIKIPKLCPLVSIVLLTIINFIVFLTDKSNKQMEITIQDIKEAYRRLKTHVYYDTSDLFIRKRLAEFETDKYSSESPFWISEYANQNIDQILSGEEDCISMNDKFDRILDAIKNDVNFFDVFFKKMEVKYLPKKFTPTTLPKNFISNTRIKEEYEVERASAFIDIPIELHLITVLWIMKYGKSFDAELSEHAYGNRLLLNQQKDDLIEGSCLFKPYYKQYARWRDNAVNSAKASLDNGEDVLFINLDIKDYYYSVRLSIKTDEFDFIKMNTRTDSVEEKNLLNLFMQIHVDFTKILKKSNFPYSYENKINDSEVILPIGLLSSYILGNHCLKAFDEKVIKDLKPHYYGRYVDDIIFVIKNPQYINLETSNQMIVSELRSLLEEKDNDLQIIGENYSNLTCQSDKTLLHYFDHNESDLVIDKLKRELEERASEFRDFPIDEDNTSFEESAYHLLYDGSEGKIKTLKDFKENSYGISVYLTHKIFAALRNNKKLKHDDSKKILKFFKGLNCLELFRLWEKVFVFFMVNNDPDSFVEFYIHTFLQIKKIRQKFSNDIIIGDNNVKQSLIEYIDHSLEISLALNPHFLEGNKAANKKFVYFQSEHKNWFNYITNLFSAPTNQNSFYITRYRESNLIRHHYVIQPLINYTNLSAIQKYNLIGLDIPLTSNTKILSFKEDTLLNSPRPVKFWECCIACMYMALAQKQTVLLNNKEDLKLDLFSFSMKEIRLVEDVQPLFYLDQAFELYKKINQNHFNCSDELKSKLYRYFHDVSSSECDITEFEVNKDDKLKDVRISFANIEVNEKNIESSIRGIPRLTPERYNTFQKIFKDTRAEKANILLLPENALPYQFLSSLVRYSSDNSIMAVSGIEHWTVNNYSFNFIVSVLPVTVNNVKDAVVVIRLKNHYSPGEKEIIRGEHLYCPKPMKYRYDLINWRNVYFSAFYCFELANSVHRSMFRSKVDLIVASEWNKDTPYFSNIVESLSRDIHAYIAQVNTSQYGDSRLTKPSSSSTKDILKLKGGKNDTILIGEINFDSLRTFQRKDYNRTKDDTEFKPLPPDYEYKNAIKRENNQRISDNSKSDTI